MIKYAGGRSLSLSLAREGKKKKKFSSIVRKNSPHSRYKNVTLSHRKVMLPLRGLKKLKGNKKKNPQKNVVRVFIDETFQLSEKFFSSFTAGTFF